MITQFDRPTVKALRVEIDKALEIVSQTYGIKISTGNARFTPSNLTFKVEFATKTADGTVIRKETTDFKSYAGLGMLGKLTENDLGRQFNYLGKTFKITGYRPRASKRPLLVEDIQTGKGYCVPITAVCF